MSRRINLDVPDLPNEKICSWLNANRIDPGTVPAAQEVLVTEESITYVEFLFHEDGPKIISLREDGTPFVEKQLKTVPLLVDPSAHGL